MPPRHMGAPPPNRDRPAGDRAAHRKNGTLNRSKARNNRSGRARQVAQRAHEGLRILRQQRATAQICRTPRLVVELLDEIGRHHGIAAETHERMARHAAADPTILAAPVHLVGDPP